MSIYTLTEYLLTLATDMGVLIGLIGQEQSDAFSRRLQTFLYVESESDLHYLPGRFTCIETTELGDLWSCTLSNDCSLYFIPTQKSNLPYYPMYIAQHATRAVIIVGIETKKGSIGYSSKENIDENYGSTIKLNNKSTTSRQIFERKVV